MQEQRHLRRFDQLIAERRVRPTVLHPLWNSAGFMLGAGTALISEEAAMAVRMVAHWLAFAPLLLVATLPAAVLLGLEGDTLRTVVLGLLAGTPGLAAIGLLIAALTASLRTGAALAGLLLIPLSVPILIFGAGALARPDASGLAFAAAISLVLVAVTPFAAGAALRAAREN